MDARLTERGITFVMANPEPDISELFNPTPLCDAWDKALVWAAWNDALAAAIAADA